MSRPADGTAPRGAAAALSAPPGVDEERPVFDAVWTELASRPDWVGATADQRAAWAAAAVAAAAPLASDGSRRAVVERVIARACGLGPLEAVLSDPAVSEVMVNPDGWVWVERRGALERTPVWIDESEVVRVIERIVAPLGVRADRSSPLVDARLDDGARVNAVLRPLAVDGPCLTIRRFGALDIPLRAFCPASVEALLVWAVRARANLLVSGGTGSGKTTLLNALAALFAPGERIITIEDTAELRLPGDHVVRLETRAGNAEGAGSWSVRDLVRNALRMRPDRIVVGEVRGPEALDMVQAMNTGHEGSMSTCHANSPPDALRRVETMILFGETSLGLPAVREQVRSSVDLVVQVARGVDGARRVVAVHEVLERESGDGRTTVAVADASSILRVPRRGARWDAAGPPPQPGDAAA